MRMTSLIMTLSVAGGFFASLALAKDTDSVVFIGSYEKVESSTGEHCYGYSIDIWKQNGQPFGLLHYHTGLCGDPPCGVLEAVNYDAKNGKLSFNVETRLSKFRFSGKLTRDSLTGSLQESPTGQISWTKGKVDLPRKRDSTTEEFYGEPRSLAEWHARYDSYGRCLGITGYMKSAK
ncbi:MAG: hypothetical protein ACYC2E_03830 [Sulfuricella sp.]